MKNNKKKGFTLVELLVVIAIIAILATVSVVGYLGFTKKAHESKAVSELTQVKTELLASLADGVEENAEYVFTFANNALTVEKKATPNTPVTGADLETAVNSVYSDLVNLKGSLSFNGTEVTYTLEDNAASAKWIIASGVVEATK